MQARELAARIRLNNLRSRDEPPCTRKCDVVLDTATTLAFERTASLRAHDDGLDQGRPRR